MKRRDKPRKHTDLMHRAPGQKPLRRGREDWGAGREKGFWLQNPGNRNGAHDNYSSYRSKFIGLNI